jgi:hypothetical protein
VAIHTQSVGGARRWTSVLIAVLCTCGVPIESPTDPGPPVHEIQYEYRWDWGDAATLEDGSWTVTNDQGFFIRVTSGAITHYSVQLVPCPADESEVTWQNPFGVANAWAGHSDIPQDPSFISQQFVQSLVNPAPQTAHVTVVEHIYCQVHAVLGPADSEANGLGRHVFMQDRTLVLDGVYRAPASSDEIPFHLESALGIGGFLEWDGARVDMSGVGVRVVLTHRLDTLFYQVNFETQNSSEIAWAVMSNVLSHATVQVQRSTAPAESKTPYP